MNEQIKADVDQFMADVKDKTKGLNPITGRALHHFIRAAGGSDALGESDAAECLRRSANHLPDTSGRRVHLAQSASEFLLDKAAAAAKKPTK